MNPIIFLLVILNFAISWFNAWSVGRAWAETKAMGGFARFMSWCGAIMSASGFTWCYLIILAVVGMAIPGKYHLPEKYAQGMLSLGYLIIILPVLGSGLAITVQSWAYFWRERSFKNGAVAGWNTFADIYNIYEAVRGIPESLSFLEDLFSGKSSDKDDEDKNFLTTLIIALVILAVVGGILTTVVIIRCTARSVANVQVKRVENEPAQGGGLHAGYYRN